MKTCNISVTNFATFGLNAICNLIQVTEKELSNETEQDMIESSEMSLNFTAILFEKVAFGAKCRYYEHHSKRPEEKVDLLTRSILASLFTILLVLSIISNAACAHVAYHFLKIEKTTSYMLLSLVVSDAVHTLVLYPLEMNNLMHNMFWKLGKTCCKVIPFMISTTNLASSLTLCCIAVSRCFYVVRACKSGPQPANKYSGIAACAIIASWVISGLLSVVYLLTFKLNEEYADPRTELCGKLEEYRVYEKVKVCFFDDNVFKSETLTKYYLYVLPSTVFIPLFITMGIGYSYLSFVLWSTKTPTTHGHGERKRHKYQKIIRVLLALVALFFLCRLPVVIYNWMVGTGEYQVNRKIVTFRYFLVLLRFTNCVLNPFFYGLIHDHFRKTIEKLFAQLKERAQCLNKKRTPDRDIVPRETTETLYSSIFKGNVFFQTVRNYTPTMHSRVSRY